MQFAARIALLAALCVASVCARQRCATDAVGRLSGHVIPLKTVRIPARDTGIDIPSSCAFGQRYVGMEIRVCDVHNMPTVTALSLNHAQVHLRGPPGNAVADITEYCESYGTGSQVEDVEEQRPVTYNLDSDE